VSRRRVALVSGVALVLAAGALGSTRVGMWRTVHVRLSGDLLVPNTSPTGELHSTTRAAFDAMFSEHSGGVSLHPCHDSITDGKQAGYSFPKFSGSLESRGDNLMAFSGTTATWDSSGLRDVPIHEPGEYWATVEVGIAGPGPWSRMWSGYELYTRSMTLRADGSGSGTLATPGGMLPDGTPGQLVVTVDWTCHDGLLPVG